MSALGHKRTFSKVCVMSALCHKQTSPNRGPRSIALDTIRIHRSNRGYEPAFTIARMLGCWISGRSYSFGRYDATRLSCGSGS